MANTTRSELHENFLKLVRLGIGTSKDAKISNNINWIQLRTLASEQGLSAVILDALNTEGSNLTDGMPLTLKLEWIGEVLQDYEGRYSQYKKAIGSLAGFYNQHGFKVMILKGYACSLDWPKPEHRPCGDIDIWQFGKQKEADALLESLELRVLACCKRQSRAESLESVESSKFKVDNSQHHHTVFEWQSFTVENHYDFINVHHHPSHRGMETIFKELGKDDTHFVEVGGERVYVPSPNLHALFLLRHALNHFASVGINLRNVIDWAFFIEKHTNEIDWNWFDKMIDEYHLRDFYNCINAICVEDLGFSPKIFPLVQFSPRLKDKMLKDILDPEFKIEEPNGFCRRWIYKYRRWKGNRWKQELCFKESAWCAFWSGVWGHILKPSSI